MPAVSLALGLALLVLVVVVAVAVVVLAYTARRTAHRLRRHEVRDDDAFRNLAARDTIQQSQLAALQAQIDALAATPPQSQRALTAADPVQAIPVDTFTALLFPTVAFEDGVSYNALTGGFTVSADGMYALSADLQAFTVAAGVDEVEVELFASVGPFSGVTPKYGRQRVQVPAPPPTAALSTCSLVRLGAGATVYFVTRVLNAASASTSLLNVAQNNAAVLRVAD